MKALVIGNSDAARAFVDRLLRHTDYRAVTATDGVDAQQIVLKDGPPDLVVIDETLPRMSGHEFTDWMHANFPGVKVLSTSSLTVVAERITCRR